MYSPKHVEQLRNIGIINPTTRLHLVGSFYETKHFTSFLSRAGSANPYLVLRCKSLLVLRSWASMWHAIRARNHGVSDVSLRIRILRLQIYGLIVEPKPWLLRFYSVGVVVPTDTELKFNQRSLTLRRLTSYIYGAPILDVSRSHTTTQHSR